MNFESYISMMGGVVNDNYKDEKHLDDLRSKFHSDGYVRLPGLLKNKLSSIYLDEALRLNKYCDACDFMMPQYNTPRILSVIGGQKILSRSSMFSMLYLDFSIQELVSLVVGKHVYHIHHKEEFMVINYLEKKGGTHGWHLDDPRYALVLILKAPDVNDGGWLEVIPNWDKYCRSLKFDPEEDVTPAIKYAVENDKVKKIRHCTGDVYLLNAGDCMHRVAPITGEVSRIVLNMAFDDRETVSYGCTADSLYGGMLNEEEVRDVRVKR